MSAWRGVLLATLIGLAGSLSLGLAGLTIFPFQAPSVCAGSPCEAAGAMVLLPNSDRIDVEVAGPGRGITYDAAGSPSNVVAR